MKYFISGKVSQGSAQAKVERIFKFTNESSRKTKEYSMIRVQLSITFFINMDNSL